MRIQKLHIKNFRYIRSLEICDIENALILVGKNNVGKTAVLSIGHRACKTKVHRSLDHLFNSVCAV